jgi:hypothetical protein
MPGFFLRLSGEPQAQFVPAGALGEGAGSGQMLLVYTRDGPKRMPEGCIRKIYPEGGDSEWPFAVLAEPGPGCDRDGRRNLREIFRVRPGTARWLCRTLGLRLEAGEGRPAEARPNAFKGLRANIEQEEVRGWQT